MSVVAILQLCKRKKKKLQDPQEDITSLLIPEKRGTVLEALACCVSILPGTDNKATLLYFLQTLSAYFCLASVDQEPRV